MAAGGLRVTGGRLGGRRFRAPGGGVRPTADRVRESLIWKVCQFSLGRPLGFRDAPVVQKIHAEARKKGGTWPALMTALITSDLVRLTRTEAQ